MLSLVKIRSLIVKVAYFRPVFDTDQSLGPAAVTTFQYHWNGIRSIFEGKYEEYLMK